MDLFTSLLSGGGGLTGIIALVGGVIAFIVSIFVAGSRSGGNREKLKAAKQANKGWVEANDHIGQAKKARLRTHMRDGADIMSDDGHKRPSD